MKNLLIIAIASMLSLTAAADNVSDIIKKAKHGDSAAQLEYARLLTTAGNGVKQDWNKAVKMFQQSAANGNPDAQWELGLLYEYGNHVDKDEQKAFELYSKSADSGSPIGTYLVAHCYQHGISVTEDRSMSDKLYAQSMDGLMALAPQEDKYVLNFIGSAYQWGDGVKADRKKAFEYYLISAHKGNPETQYKVGTFYERGQGVPRDRQAAIEWYGKSAAQGYQQGIDALASAVKSQEKYNRDMEKVRKVLIETCEAMEKKAREMDMIGVAVATILPKSTRVDWVAEMKVVDKTYKVDPDGTGWNLVAIAWSKTGEVIASGADSGNKERKRMMGELNYVGGAYDETDEFKFAFAFSGGDSEDDLAVAKYGIEYAKSLLK